MKFADMTVHQIHQLIGALKRQIPDLEEVAFRTCIRGNAADSKDSVILWGSWKDGSEISKGSYGICGAGTTENAVTEVVRSFMEDYRRAVEALLKRKSSQVSDLLRELELEIPTPITGEDMAAIAAPAKEAA